MPIYASLHFNHIINFTHTLPCVQTVLAQFRSDASNVQWLVLGYVDVNTITVVAYGMFIE